MSIQVYKLLHLMGIFLVLTTLASAAWNRRFQPDGIPSGKKFLGMIHGIGMFLVILGGFGMMARLSIHWPWPIWIWLKMSIWLILGGVLSGILRMPKHAKAYWWSVYGLAIFAAYLALFKPMA